MDPHILSSLVILLSIACGAVSISKWLHIPYTILLVLIGLVVAFLKITPQIYIENHIIFSVILPPLLFQGAMHVDLEKLKLNWKAISMLAVPGVVVSTFLIGYLLHIFWKIDLTYALLFGALITPTDPISVLSILREVNAPKRLQLILEGESLFNDGTGVVVFAIILAIITGEGHHNLSAGESFLKFLKVALGGTFIGFVVGVLAFKMLKQINDHLHEVAITVALTFGTPLLAEYFHMSGIIAIVVAGMIIGNHGKHYSMSEQTRSHLESFWSVIEFILNSLLFILIGVELQVVDYHELFHYWQPICFGIAALLISRALVVYPVVWIKNIISHDKRDIPWSWSHILFWGGLKGSLSIALVVGMPEGMEHRPLFLTVAFGIVLFSLLVQGLTIKPMIQKLGISSRA